MTQYIDILHALTRILNATNGNAMSLRNCTYFVYCIFCALKYICMIHEPHTLQNLLKLSIQEYLVFSMPVLVVCIQSHEI